MRLLDQVQDGRVHVAIAPLPNGSSLEGKELFPFGVLAILPSCHKLGHRKSIDVTDLAFERLLLLRRAFMTRQIFEGACKLVHVAPPVVMESSSPHALMSLASQRHGIAIIPSTVKVAAQHAIPVQLGKRQLGVIMSAIWNPRRYLPPAALCLRRRSVQLHKAKIPRQGVLF